MVVVGLQATRSRCSNWRTMGGVDHKSNAWNEVCWHERRREDEQSGQQGFAPFRFRRVFSTVRLRRNSTSGGSGANHPSHVVSDGNTNLDFSTRKMTDDGQMSTSVVFGSLLRP